MYMSKITFAEFEQVMSCDLNKKSGPCIEIDFYVDDYVEYQESCMGKMLDREDTKKVWYWFGLVPDGSQAHDFNTFEEFANAKVFYGSKTLKEIWDSVSIYSLGGGQVHETLPYFLSLEAE